MNNSNLSVRLNEEFVNAMNFCLEQPDSILNIDPSGIPDRKTTFLFQVGDPNSPYYGTIIKGCIDIPAGYPNTNPDIYFTPPIYHINVNGRTGKFCFYQTEWNNSMTLIDALLIAAYSLSCPNWAAPDGESLLKEYRSDNQGKEGWFNFVKSKNYLYDNFL